MDSKDPAPAHSALSPMPLHKTPPVYFEEGNLEQFWYEPQAHPIRSDSTPSLNPPCSPPQSVSLKGLSRKVKEIVNNTPQLTYKQVADEILKGKTPKPTSRALKEEKNVRRRVYDALNVLIAAKILTKHGKLVSPMNSFYRMSFRIVKGTELLSAKRQKLVELAQHYTAIRNLYERNMMQSRTADYVPFPFTLVAVPSDFEVRNRQLRMVNALGNSQVVIEMVTKGEVLQEAEVLKKLKLHSNANDLPTELKQLLPPN